MKRKFAVAAIAIALVVGVAGFGVLAQDEKADKKSDGKGYLGVYIEDVGAKAAQRYETKRTEGAMVMAVVPGSAAAEAGLKSGDVIISIDGRAIANAENLTDAISAHKKGDVVTIVLERKGVEQTVKAALKERSDARIVIAGKTPNVFSLRKGEGPEPFYFQFGGGGLGIRYEELNKDLGTYFGASEGKGVLVIEVMEKSAAAAAGLKSGDVIISLDGRDITDGEDLRHALSRMAKDEKESAEMVILRDKQRKTVTVKPDKSRNMFHVMPKMHNMHLRLDGLRESLEGLKGLDHFIDGELAMHLDELEHFDFDFEMPEIVIPDIEPILLDLDIDPLVIDMPPFDFEDFLPVDLDLDLPFGMGFHLQIDDDGAVTFNDRHFDSMEAFKAYLKSEEFHKEYPAKSRRPAGNREQPAVVTERAVA